MPALKNPKHEAFVRGLLEGKSAGDAYAAAGFQSADRGNASRLRSNPKVEARLAELQEEIAAKVPVTIESLIGELEQARTQATGKNQFAAAIKAILGKAQLSGLLVEKKHAKLYCSLAFWPASLPLRFGVDLSAKPPGRQPNRRLCLIAPNDTLRWKKQGRRGCRT